MNIFRRRLAGAPVAPSGPYMMPQRGRWRRLPSVTVVLTALVLGFVALMVGLVVALGAPQLTLMTVGVIVLVPFVVLVGTQQLLPLMFIYIFLIQGVANSAFRFKSAVWMGSGFAFLFLCRTLLELGDPRTRRGVQTRPSFGATVICVCAVLYLAFFFFSLSIGRGTVPQIVSVIRFSLPMFGVLLAMYCFEFTESRLRKLWTLLLLVIVLQVPVVLYQHFFTMSVDGWDSVVGTFGYGMSPVLVMFAIAGITYALSCWMRGLIKGWWMALVVCAGLADMLLGEVKAVLFWTPLAIILVMRKRILKNVVAFVGYGVMIVVFLAATVFAYKAMYWGEEGTSGSTLEEKISRRGGYFFNPYEINQKTGEVSRIASLYIWYRDPVPTVLERLIGYGPGSSATSDGTGLGKVAKRYRPLRVNSTALSSMLWDIGILGTACFISMLAAGILTALRFVRRGTAPPWQLAIADASMVILVVLSTTLIYNRNLVDETTVQLLAFFCLGSIVQLSRFTPRETQDQAAVPR